MIIRGTTPYHSFDLPLTSDQIDTLYITYMQNDEVILDKQLGEEGIEIVDSNINSEIEPETESETETDTPTDEETTPAPSSKVTIHLTQEDTLAFTFYPAARKNIAVRQVRVLSTDGEAYASDPIIERVFGVLKDGVIESTGE